MCGCAVAKGTVMLVFTFHVQQCRGDHIEKHFVVVVVDDVVVVLLHRSSRQLICDGRHPWTMGPGAWMACFPSWLSWRPALERHVCTT